MTYCDIPMTTLRVAPFLLKRGDTVVFIVRAVNSLGQGSYSQPNTNGAQISVEPSKMNAPVRGDQTSEGQLQILWDALTGDSTGGAAIDSYNLRWD